MKKFVLSVFAIAAMASCMQDETISQNQQAIDFGTPFVDKATKAKDLTYGETTVELREFYVYGTVTGTAGTVNIFKNAKVYCKENEHLVGTDKVWNCDVKQYWIPGASYVFDAVVDATVTTGEYDMPTTLEPVAAENGNLKDLLYDTAKETGAETHAPVDFNFKHLLAKAYFTVKSNTEGGYYYSVKNISVQNIKTGAKYVIARGENGEDNGAWEATALDTDVANWISFGNIEKITKADTNGKTNEYQTLLVPTAKEFKVSFTVELWNDLGDTDAINDVKLSTVTYADDDADTTHNAKVVSIKEGEELVGLQAGHAYNFNLELKNGKLIEFTVTTAPAWENDTNITL